MRPTLKTLRRMVTASAPILLIPLMIGVAHASNMGFKKVFNLAPAGSNNQPISLPYFYTPTDVNANGLDSEDLCRDLNGGVFQAGVSPVQFVKRYNTATDTITGHNCALSAIGNFALLKGVGYFIANQGAIPINSTVVGSHDDSFSVSFPASGSNNNFWSLPYHIMLTDVNSNGLDTEDLCRSVNGGVFQAGVSPMQFVKRYNTATDTITGHNCALAAIGNFNLTIGTGYFLANQGAITINYLPPHY